MAELAEAIEPESEVVVAEGIADTELLLGGHTDLKLVLGTRVRNNLPVVLSIHKGSVGYHGAE